MKTWILIYLGVDSSSLLYVSQKMLGQMFGGNLSCFQGFQPSVGR